MQLVVNTAFKRLQFADQVLQRFNSNQKLGGLDSNSPDLKPNEDGSYTIWFAPKPPEGKEGNWIQTIPGKSWSTVLRLYGPLESWFDGSWKPEDVVLVE